MSERVNISKYRKRSKYFVGLRPSVVKSPGTKLIKVFPKTEPVVAMCTWQDKIYLATTRHVYLMEKDKVIPLRLRKEKSWTGQKKQ